MRYQNLRVDVVDVDFLDFSDGGLVGNVVLYGTDELIKITNDIRKECGNNDLVEVECDIDVRPDTLDVAAKGILTRHFILRITIVKVCGKAHL